MFQSQSLAARNPDMNCYDHLRSYLTGEQYPANAKRHFNVRTRYLRYGNTATGTTLLYKLNFKLL